MHIFICIEKRVTTKRAKIVGEKSPKHRTAFQYWNIQEGVESNAETVDINVH